MADENNTPAADTPAEESKAKTVIDDMDNRRLFDSPEDAAAYIGKCQEEYADFNSYPVAAVGLTEEGDFDPEVYTDEMQIAIAVLTQRGEGAGSSTVKAIVIYPSPKVESLLTSATGAEWVAGLVQKEANHVAVRQLRKADGADEIADAIQTMPTSIEAYTTSGRESTGGILQTYNDLWQLIKKAIASKSTPFRLANLSKKELRKAMDSSAYALAVYPKLEDRENKKGEKESLFEVAANYGLVLAKAKGLDPTVFERMITQRDEKIIEAADDEDEGEFDFEAMTAEFDKEAAPAVAEVEADLDSDEGEAPESTEAADTDGAAS